MLDILDYTKNPSKTPSKYYAPTTVTTNKNPEINYIKKKNNWSRGCCIQMKEVEAKWAFKSVSEIMTDNIKQSHARTLRHRLMRATANEWIDSSTTENVYSKCLKCLHLTCTDLKWDSVCV